MNRVSLFSRAPSNIALIKYMGKLDSELNLPANGSLSMTLDALCTQIELRETTVRAPGVGAFSWVPELPRACEKSSSVPTLSTAGVARYLSHAERVIRLAPDLLREAGVSLRETRETGASWEIRSANNFPSDSGIASSASSFAALTLVVAASLARDPQEFDRAVHADSSVRRGLASISRQGSGSSCRSFDGPWVEWQGAETTTLQAQLPALTDLILIAGESKKEVSSSEAHRRVRQSPLWAGRPERAEARRIELRKALEDGSLTQASRLAWAETWEMHSLFHTADEPFTYWEPQTLSLLKWLSPRIRDRAIVTLDAGPNVHLLIPSPDAPHWKGDLLKAFPDLPILEDRQGTGASLLWGQEK